MSWKDRLQPEIVLQSPSGETFTATWRGDNRSMEKRLGVFEFPKIPGAWIQDMGVGPARYPLSFYFDGDDHDLIASRFFLACKEVGLWDINHPTLGVMHLQLMGVTEEIHPVESAGLTLISTEWLEPMDGGLIQTVPQLEEEILYQAEEVEIKAAEQFASNVEEITAFQSKLTMAGKVYATIKQIKDTIDRVKALVNNIRSTIENVYRSIVNTVQGVVTSVVSLAGAVQALVKLPGQMTTDLASRFNFYGKILGDSISSIPRDRMTLAVNELIATSCIVGMARAIVDSDITSREEALQALDALNVYFSTMTHGLDNGQAVFTDKSVTKQYFSQSESFNDTLQLVTMVTELLLRRSYDLAVAKRFTLTRHRAPIEIALTEGVDLDRFIKANHLTGDDILLLPQGRQVVVYL